MIKLGELIEYNQPEIWQVLVRRYLCFIVDWEEIISERPKPGVGGLLPGENWLEGGEFVNWEIKSVQKW